MLGFKKASATSIGSPPSPPPYFRSVPGWACGMRTQFALRQHFNAAYLAKSISLQ